MDSTGLGVLVGRLKLVRVQDGSLKLVCTRSASSRSSGSPAWTRSSSIHDSIDEAARSA